MAESERLGAFDVKLGQLLELGHGRDTVGSELEPPSPEATQLPRPFAHYLAVSDRVRSRESSENETGTVPL